MRDLGDLLEALNRFDPEAIAERAIQETSDRITKLNREQLHEGNTSEERKIHPSYRSPFYAELKNQQNPAPGIGNPDLFLTGDFYAGFITDVQGGDVHTFSTDSKADALEEKYGADMIYGLGPEKHTEYVEEDLSPAYAFEVSKALKLPTL